MMIIALFNSVFRNVQKLERFFIISFLVLFDWTN